ncbi:hypothetical protein PIB30_035072 [Stylosanthes scabra]|uniref:Uncharacterized protein n=1 Tax=Stylosanthes scabra TaxID=79078 RepID=A0ABU6ZCD3_9FABA|nr:hypothetical protein [Stylosanthes scabra]
MPIYHDYHSDSKSSSISTWDQIQISHKSLLPSYQSILCDSAIVESFLSDQPQMQLSADFEQNSDAATIQNATKFLDPDQEKSESLRQIPEITTSEQSKSESAFQILNISSTNQKEEWNSANYEDQKQAEEDELDARRNYCGLDNQNEAVVLQRPPPEPPDLQSPVKKLFPFQTATCQNMKVVAENECGIHTSVEDVAVAKGKVKTEVATSSNARTREAVREATAIGGAASQTLGFSVPIFKTRIVEASITHFMENSNATDLAISGNTEIVDEAGTSVVASATHGGLRACQLRWLVLLIPPPLLGVVFPWNRGSEKEERSPDSWMLSTEKTIRVQRDSEVLRRKLEIGRRLARTEWVSSSTATGICWGRGGDEALALGTVVAGRRGGARASWKGGRGAVEGENQGGQGASGMAVVGDAMEREFGSLGFRMVNVMGNE